MPTFTLRFRRFRESIAEVDIDADCAASAIEAAIGVEAPEGVIDDLDWDDGVNDPDESDPELFEVYNRATGETLPYYDGPKLEPILPLSTAHAPSAEDLDAAISKHASMSRPEGALFYAGDGAIIAEMPDWLIGLLRFAQQNGAVWLMLDCDADRVDDLPSWEW